MNTPEDPSGEASAKVMAVVRCVQASVLREAERSKDGTPAEQMAHLMAVVSQGRLAFAALLHHLEQTPESAREVQLMTMELMYAGIVALTINPSGIEGVTPLFRVTRAGTPGAHGEDRKDRTKDPLGEAPGTN